MSEVDLIAFQPVRGHQQCPAELLQDQAMPAASRSLRSAMHSSPSPNADCLRVQTRCVRPSVGRGKPPSAYDRPYPVLDDQSNRSSHRSFLSTERKRHAPRASSIWRMRFGCDIGGSLISCSSWLSRVALMVKGRTTGNPASAATESALLKRLVHS